MIVNVDKSWTIDEKVSILNVSWGSGDAHDILYRA